VSIVKKYGKNLTGFCRCNSGNISGLVLTVILIKFVKSFGKLHYDYELIKEKIDVYKDADNVSGGGSSIQERDEYRIILLMICLLFAAAVGVKRKRPIV